MTLNEALTSLTVMELKQRCSQIPNLRPGNRKDGLVAGLAGYLLSESLATLVEALTELERNAVAETVHNWGGSFHAVGFEAKYGSLPGVFTYNPYSYGHSKKDRQPSALALWMTCSDR